ncbi:hypothetical protein BJX65DRAFT_312280 [Aspergillus insuetus]
MYLLKNLLIFIAIAINTVLATIALGSLEFQKNKPILNVAWIEGNNPCILDEYITPISASGQSPCGIRFTLTNGYTYYEENCGVSAIVIRNGDGSFNSQCKQKSWSCVSGDHTYRQTWTCS